MQTRRNTVSSDSWTVNMCTPLRDERCVRHATGALVCPDSVTIAPQIKRIRTQSYSLLASMLSVVRRSCTALPLPPIVTAHTTKTPPSRAPFHLLSKSDMSTSIHAGLNSEAHDYYKKIPKVTYPPTHSQQLCDMNVSREGPYCSDP